MTLKISIGKKKLLLSLLILAAVVVGVYSFGVWQVHRLNDKLFYPATKSGLIASFPLADDCTLVSISGQRVYFDMGSRHSFIRRDIKDQLKAEGYPMEEIPVLMYTTDCDGHYNLYTQKVRLNILFPNPEEPDSTYEVKNVELLVSDDPYDNLIGMDVLQHVVVEHINETDKIRLYHSLPEGYEEVCDIEVHESPLGHIISPSRRASIKLAVNDDEPRDYFFDTGGKMRAFELVQPTSKLHSATSTVRVDSTTGLAVQDHCRVSFGNRLRYCDVVYSDTLHTDDYSVNPLKLFNQDIVIDFPNQKLYTRTPRK